MPITDYYVTTDAMGSVMAVLDESGNVLERRSYDAFGEATYMLPDGTVVPDSPTGVDIGFQGQLMDELTGLYQMGYRWYSPVLGRWVSRDPIGLEGGMNLYSSCRNSMTIAHDPWGKQATPPVNSNNVRSEDYSDVEGFELIFRWVTGTGPQHYAFVDGDKFTETLRRSDEIQDMFRKAHDLICSYCKTGRSGPPPSKDFEYNYKGVYTGIKKYLGDMFLPEPMGGNRSLAFLGSFSGRWTSTKIECCKTAEIKFVMDLNVSGGRSGSRIPGLGYSNGHYIDAYGNLQFGKPSIQSMLIGNSPWSLPGSIFDDIPRGRRESFWTIDETLTLTEKIDLKDC